MADEVRKASDSPKALIIQYEFVNRSKCSYVIKKDESILRFVFSAKDGNPSIKNVCSITESSASTRNSENEIRTVATIIHRRIFTTTMSRNVPDFAGYCENSYAESDYDSESEKVGFKRDLSTCFSADIRDSNEESNGGSLYKNSDKYNSVLTCTHEVDFQIKRTEIQFSIFQSVVKRVFCNILKIFESILTILNVMKYSRLVQIKKFYQSTVL